MTLAHEPLSSPLASHWRADHSLQLRSPHPQATPVCERGNLPRSPFSALKLHPSHDLLQESFHVKSTHLFYLTTQILIKFYTLKVDVKTKKISNFNFFLSPTVSKFSYENFPKTAENCIMPNFLNNHSSSAN